MMGDVNLDNVVNIMDVVLVINHIKGTGNLTGTGLSAATVSGGNTPSITDVVLMINYLKGTAVLPSGGYILATTTNSTEIKLSPNGTKLGTVGANTSIKVIAKAGEQVNGVYWDLIVASNGMYGYINRNNWK